MNLLKVLWILVVAFLNLSCGWGSNDDFKEEERPPSSSLSKTTAPIISNLPHLPEEIWVKIFKGLSQKDWYHFQYASKEFYSIALNPLLSWCKTFQERKDKILSNTPAEEIWKEYHAAKYGRRQYYLSIEKILQSEEGYLQFSKAKDPVTKIYYIHSFIMGIPGCEWGKDMRKLFFPPEKQEKAWETESPRALEVALIDYGNPLFTEKYLFQWLLPLHRTIQAGLYTEEAFPIKNYKAQFKAIYFLQSYTHSGVGEFEGHTYKEYRKILFNQFSRFFIKSLNISLPSTSYLKEIQRTWFEVGKEFENKEAIKCLEKLNN